MVGRMLWRVTVHAKQSQHRLSGALNSARLDRVTFSRSSFAFSTMPFPRTDSPGAVVRCSAIWCFILTANVCWDSLDSSPAPSTWMDRTCTPANSGLDSSSSSATKPGRRASNARCEAFARCLLRANCFCAFLRVNALVAASARSCFSASVTLGAETWLMIWRDCEQRLHDFFHVRNARLTRSISAETHLLRQLHDQKSLWRAVAAQRLSFRLPKCVVRRFLQFCE